MAFEMSDKPQTIKIYNLRADTNEFIGAGDAYIPPHTGLPANSTTIAPPAVPADRAAIFNEKEQSWSLTEDHRSETVYDISTGQAVFISELGPLPENTVTIAPSSQFEKWDGNAWVKDEEAEKNARQAEAAEKQRQLIADARTVIGEWQTALMLGSLSDEDKVRLRSWLDYIQALKNVVLSNPQWPDKPSE